jgi:hypothetical protein
MLTVFAVVLLPASSGGAASSVRVLSSDLAFNFVCKAEARATLEDETEGFLRRAGFKVLNLARLRREHGITTLPVDIIALDGQKRMIAIILAPLPIDEYSASLRTPPPTHRDRALEQTLLRFVANELKCEVRQLSRSDNGANVADLYEEELRGIENVFREAEELDAKHIP